jgi:hypothetical protein
VIGLFISHKSLLNSFLVCKQWKQTLDNENFYKTATKLKDTHRFERTWKLTFISLYATTWDPNRKHHAIVISKNGKSDTGN